MNGSEKKRLTQISDFAAVTVRGKVRMSSDLLRMTMSCFAEFRLSCCTRAVPNCRV